MTDWANLPPLEPERAIFLASDNSLHSVPIRFLRNARASDAGLIVLARSPEEWRTFVQSQFETKNNTLTDDDRRMLAEIGIAAWSDSSLENLVLAILSEPPRH